MTVLELISILSAMPPDLLVAADKFSEQVLLEKDGLVLVEACNPREDGWVHDKRPDKPTRLYLCIRP